MARRRVIALLALSCCVAGCDMLAGFVSSDAGKVDRPRDAPGGGEAVDSETILPDDAGKPADALVKGSCVHDEHRLDVTSQTLGGVAFDSATGYAYVAGVNSTHPAHIQMRKAMAAPAAMPEFRGNVAAVHTANYWDEELHQLRQRGNQVRTKQRELQKDKSLTKQQVREAINKFRENLYTEKEKKILTGASNADYHYMGSGKVMALIGKAFAEAIRDMSR